MRGASKPSVLNSQVPGHGHGELKAEELEALEVALRSTTDARDVC